MMRPKGSGTGSSDERLTRRAVLVSLGTLALALSPALNASVTPRLIVFANTDMRARAFEKQLEQELPGVDVTVFSRVRGFELALAQNPDAVLALEPVLRGFGLKVDTRGYRDGKATERYVLLANGRTVAPSELDATTKLGVVNILGRKAMPDFVSSVLGVPSPKLAYVTHERDLLPLLQFGAAAVVLTSDRWANMLRQRSQMNLRATILHQEVGLPAVSYVSSSVRASLEQKLSAAQSANGELGVDQWR